MNFDKTFAGIDCKCLDGSLEDNESIFLRRVGESKTLKERDFKTHIERGKTPPSNSCDDQCGYRGLSIEKHQQGWDEFHEVRKSLTNAFSPQHKYQMAKIKINPDFGAVKFTPEQQGGSNPFHYDFYKSSAFDINSLTHIGFI